MFPACTTCRSSCVVVPVFVVVDTGVHGAEVVTTDEVVGDEDTEHVVELSEDGTELHPTDTLADPHDDGCGGAHPVMAAKSWDNEEWSVVPDMFTCPWRFTIPYIKCGSRTGRATVLLLKPGVGTYIA